MKKRDLPAPFAEIEARQMEMDRSYFEQHPNATEYERAYIPGEFWPADWNVSPRCNTANARILVKQMQPGVRSRKFHFDFKALAQRSGADRLPDDVAQYSADALAEVQEHAPDAPPFLLE